MDPDLEMMQRACRQTPIGVTSRVRIAFARYIFFFFSAHVPSSRIRVFGRANFVLVFTERKAGVSEPANR